MRDLNTRNTFTPDEVCELAADFPNLLAIERDEHTGGAPQRNGKHFESLKHDSHPRLQNLRPGPRRLGIRPPLLYPLGALRGL